MFFIQLFSVLYFQHDHVRTLSCLSAVRDTSLRPLCTQSGINNNLQITHEHINCTKQYLHEREHILPVICGHVLSLRPNIQNVPQFCHCYMSFRILLQEKSITSCVILYAVQMCVIHLCSRLPVALIYLHESCFVSSAYILAGHWLK